MSTPIKLHDGLPYPITIAQIAVSTGDFVEKGQKLFVYQYWNFEEIVTAPGDGIQGKTKRHRVDLVGTFDSPFSGRLVTLDLKLGDEFVSGQRTIAEIKQACTHEVLYGGLCVQCGQAVEEDSVGLDMGEHQNKLTVLHTTTNIQVSEKQAYTLEQTAQKHLREEKKLVLIVDLDQTVIHCGVDPTIGEWSKDVKNPNYEALKDVKSFALDDEIVLPPFYIGIMPSTRKCWYYVKLRPGLEEFFEKIAPYFEMHIYTMATRGYALEIAKIIDPDGKLFGNRILSRDESGSLTHKSLERLFPMDQSMVLIIDDRGDVWNWCENLIKVVPYDFFVGIGDINSNFLPRQQNSMLHLGKRSCKRPKRESELLTGILDTEMKLKKELNEEVKRQEHQIHKLSDEKTTEILHNNQDIAKKLEHTASLEIQQKNRPLAELQKHLNNERLLIDDDDELMYLSNILLRVHKIYYNQLQSYLIDQNPSSLPDIKKLMPALKSNVFKNCYFVFSGLIPLHMNIEKADIVLWTNTFGAQTTSNIDYNTTHLITKTPSTVKARLAKGFNPNIKIVHPDWIFECLVNWTRVDENPYELIVEEDVSEDYIENFKKELDEAHKRKLVKESEQNQAFGEVGDPLLLLNGNGFWLDNDDDEIDKLLNDEEGDDFNSTDEPIIEDIESTHVHDLKVTEDFSLMLSNNKRSLDIVDSAQGIKRQHFMDKSTATSKAYLKNDNYDDDDDDLEAELLQELKQ